MGHGGTRAHRARKRSAIVALVLLVTTALAANAQATTYTVNTTADNTPTAGECSNPPFPGNCSLRQALNIANGDTSGTDTINFNLPANSTITLATANGPLAVTNSVPLAITGPGANQLAVSGAGSVRVFRVNNTAATTISGLTVTGGSYTLRLSAAGIDYFGSAPLTLDGLVVSGNNNSGVPSGAGGVRQGGSSSLTIRNSTISGNTVSSSGADNAGGIYNGSLAGSSLTLINSTIAKNAVTGTGTTNPDGGGIVNAGTLTTDNSTIAGNSAAHGVGGVQMDSGSTFMTANTIIATNSGSTTADCGGAGTATSQGYNVIGNGNGCAFSTSTGDHLGSTASPIDPKLGPLGDNGGTTPTMAETAGSPAVDAGNPAPTSDSAPPAPPSLIPCRTTDQRGFSRPDQAGTACDIGAFEFPGPTVTGITPSSGPATGGTSVTITGSNLAGASGVSFGLTPAASFTVDSASQITATSPPGSGTVDVTVTTPRETSATSPADQFSYTPVAPAVSTAPPTVSTTSASFQGLVNPNGSATTAVFQYGLDAKYYSPGASGPVYTAQTPAQAVGGDFVTHAVNAAVSGLVPNALYHVRLVATNGAGTTFGPDVTFMTPPLPPPGKPVLGKSFNVIPVSGDVWVKIKGHAASDVSASAASLGGHAVLTKGAGFVPLTQARQLPAGSQVDARLGTIKLKAAAPTRHGKLQTGTFNGGLFGLSQDRRGLTKGLTTLSLLEGLFPGAPSYASCKAKKAADTSPIASAALSSTVLQSLHASAHGKFRTRGRYSAATVRGTAWGERDRCDGSLTIVRRGTVEVTDFVRHVTVVVRAGHRYLARAHK
jgi:hypothetical protein